MRGWEPGRDSVIRLRPTLTSRLALVLALGFAACGRDPAPPPASSGAALPSPSAVASFQETPSPEITAAIRALLGPGGPEEAGSAEERKTLRSIYPVSAERLLWLDTADRPTPAARDALAVLNDAAAEGLDPTDYRAAPLSALAETLSSSSPSTPREIASFEAGVSLGLLRYLRQMHRGRVEPRAIGFLLNLPKDEHDYAALVREAALDHRVKEVIASITPPLVQYRLLRSVLHRYRELARAEGRSLAPLPAPPARSLKPGESGVGLDLLRARLIALGDLSMGAAPPESPDRYEGDLVEGVRRFQQRHGLEGDGVLGKSTWAALQVPLSFRLRQIELSMERMRWLPHLGERPFIAVNIPMFRLWGWDKVPLSGAPLFEMGVIVGKALNTRTPVFLEEMEYLIFRPYWNVPKSILQKEILPILHRDPGYLARQDMEIVDGQGDDARKVPATATNVDRLARGELRLRQRPGPKNALGDVKFMFPNDENVYLHSTPAPELFGRARRDFSHGCVRVENPLLLAEWALNDQPSWTRERIQEAMKGPPSQRVPLTRRVRVVLYYVTAAVMPNDGAIHFAADIYNQDPRLDRALSAATRRRP